MKRDLRSPPVPTSIPAPLLSLPLAVWLVGYVNRAEGRPLNQALKRTGQLHLLFGVLFALSLWLG